MSGRISRSTLFSMLLALFALVVIGLPLQAQERPDGKAKAKQDKAKAKQNKGKAKQELDKDKTPWLVPRKAEPVGTKYKTFHSESVKGEASYLIYLPPDYEQNTSRRYPVLYWLHGVGGNQYVGSGFVELLDSQIKAGKAPAMIVVLPSGGPNFWCDTKDGRFPVESLIIKDLIPHVDKSYRTIAAREGRGIEGFSMGGFGALHLAFKYPELFCAVSNISAPMPSSPSQSPGGERYFQHIFGGDTEYCEANSPLTLVQRNLDAIRGKMFIRIMVGDAENLYRNNKKLHEFFDQLKLDHEYLEAPGVLHDYRKVYEVLGNDKTFPFFQQAFGKVATK